MRECEDHKEAHRSTVDDQNHVLTWEVALGEGVVCGRDAAHDETGVVSVPPTERRDAELGDSAPVVHLAGAVRVATENQARLEPPQQLL